jgi:hypothetical protein
MAFSAFLALEMKLWPALDSNESQKNNPILVLMGLF